ncbi:unnamed protein product [Scytosiphon promiscuus]
MTLMIYARCVCTSAAARRLAVHTGRNATAPGTTGKAGSGGGTSLLQLTHRSLRTRSSPYHLRSTNTGSSSSSSNSGRRTGQLRRHQRASTLSGDKLVSPRATALAAGEKSPASTKNKAVAAWLFGTAGAVAVMVTVGGITRMTKSGLSMTDWKIQGSLPPSSEAEWEVEFDRYKAFPEWQQRRSMTMEEFKYIFFWEYAHRMLGRALGVIYGVPLLYFGLRGRIPAHIRGRVAGLFALGGTQGLVGWWMVKSGLEDRSADLAVGKEIRVSPYRLAAHLATAFATFSLLVHTGFQALDGPRVASPPAADAARRLLDSGVLKQGSNLRLMAIGVCGAAFVTAVSGAFVAGNDAGRCYNYFPKMTEEDWLPEDILALRPMWKNLFENSATVQADHRVLALTTTASALGMYWYARRGAGGGGGALWAALPAGPRAATTATAGIVTAQASLGITTLLQCAPLPLAASHQAGALTVLATSMWAAHSLRFARVPPSVIAPPSTSPRMPLRASSDSISPKMPPVVS